MRSRTPTFAAPHCFPMRSRRRDHNSTMPALNPPLCFRHMVRFLGTRCSHPATLACGGGGTRPWVCSKLHFWINLVLRFALEFNAEPRTSSYGSALESNAEMHTWTAPGTKAALLDESGAPLRIGIQCGAAGGRVRLRIGIQCGDAYMDCSRCRSRPDLLQLPQIQESDGWRKLPAKVAIE